MDKLKEMFFAFMWVAILSVYAGFIISKMWGWFIVPFGLPSINIFHAIGIDILFGVLKGSRLPLKEHEEQGLTFKVLYITIFYSLSWLVGYIAYSIM